MSTLDGQISMFELLNLYETPEIRPEEQKKGVRGWIIECSGIFLIEDGWDHDYRGVCTRRIEFEEDTEPDREAYGGWCQVASTTEGPRHGWYGPLYKVFRNRPSWNDCLKYMAETRKRWEPEAVEYYEIIGDWNGEKRTY